MEIHNGRMRRIRARLHHGALARAVVLQDDLVVVARDNGREEPCLREQPVLPKVLVRQRHDLIHVGSLDAQLRVRPPRGLQHGHHRRGGAAEGALAVDDAPRPATYAEAEEGHRTRAQVAGLAPELPHGVAGQLGLEVWHVGVQPGALVLTDALHELGVRDIALVVPEAHHLYGDAVQHLDHAHAGIERAQQRGRQEVPGQGGHYVLGRKTGTLLHDQRLEARHVVELVDVVD
mmetsp:Transcript_4437/g.12219  ORF Transcript_4437/g.12219 Transcript_4437/m.12219 type:complete len:233 (-) Transcript_4437:211-909(-)